ncbi:DUF3048 domain-containing protein [Clostridiales bacterium]|nr:DUF3048 domain-containing protein [Clostridiales bacterium]
MRYNKEQVKKRHTRLKILVIALVILVIGGGAVWATTWYKSGPGSDWPKIKEPMTNPLTGEVTAELPSRPFVLSTDNSDGARPQSGISKADIVYEFPVEGGISRLEPIYYSQIPDVVGPSRSARPYFVDMAREYKAVFVHHGWSPQAKKYLESNVIPYISAFTYGNIFYRTSSKAAPHNSYTNGKDIWKLIKEKGWDKQQDVRRFQFLGAEEKQRGDKAIDIDINYRTNKNNYKYDAKTGKYKRSVNGKPYKDEATDKQVTTSNILVQKVKSKVLDDKGRLKINMTAGGNATLFTNGVAVKGKWSRKDLDSPTIFVDQNGKEMKLNVGTTWIQVVDGGVEVKYK